eukprot:10101958-Prorocentrum_lima.AAC.1
MKTQLPKCATVLWVGERERETRRGQRAKDQLIAGWSVSGGYISRMVSRGTPQLNCDTPQPSRTPCAAWRVWCESSTRA